MNESYVNQEQEISLVDLFLIIKKYFFFLVVITLLGGLLAGIYAYALAPKSYQSETTIMVNGQHQSIKDFLLSDAVVYRSLAEVYRLDLRDDVNQGLNITFNTASAYMTIKLTLPIQGQSKRILEQLLIVATDLAEHDPLYATYKGRITTPHVVNAEIRTAPNELLVIVIGILLSGTIGVGFVFLREMIYPRFQSKKDCELTLDIDCIGTIAYVKNPVVDPIPTYDTIAQNITYLNLDGNYQVINLIPTANPMMGASEVTNIAYKLSELGKKVLVLDLDLRRRDLYRVMGLNETFGLKEFFFDGINKEEVVHTHPELRFDYLLSGSKMDSIQPILGSNKLFELIQSFRDKYDYILLISPYQKGFKDSISLAKRADGNLLIISERYTNKNDVKQALHHFRKEQVTLIGTILIDQKEKDHLLGIPLVRI